MIPFFIKKNKNESFNFLDINKYNESVNNLNPYSIQCNCGCKGSCIKYGKYKRIIDKLTFLKDNYKYKTIEAFKNDNKIFERFNLNSNEYLNISSSFNPNELIVSNKYEFDSNKYTFKKMSIIFNKENVTYKLSNIFDLFKIL